MDDLRQIPIQVVDGGDGSFDAGDYILFFGEAPDKWTLNTTTKLFAHQKNLFSGYTYYFITADLGPGLRIQPLASSTTNPNSYSRRVSDYAFHDLDSLNLIKSGKMWVGEVFTGFTGVNPDTEFEALQLKDAPEGFETRSIWKR